MDVFALIGIPFGVFLIAFVCAGYAIGGSAASPDAEQAVPSTPRSRIRRTALLLVATVLAVFGAIAAADVGAFSRLTDAGYAVEPAALLFGLEAIVDLALVIVVALPGWSARRTWILRTVGLYWLCVACPILIVSDAGTGWLSVEPANGFFVLGLPAFAWEAVACFAPVALLWFASRANAETP